MGKRGVNRVPGVLKEKPSKRTVLYPRTLCVIVNALKDITLCHLSSAAFLVPSAVMTGRTKKQRNAGIMPRSAKFGRRHVLILMCQQRFL